MTLQQIITFFVHYRIIVLSTGTGHAEPPNMTLLTNEGLPTSNRINGFMMSGSRPTISEQWTDESGRF